MYKVWHNYLIHLPRLSRYTLGAKIDKLFTELLELTLKAGYTPKTQKLIVVQNASAKLDLLKFFLKIAWELKVIDNKKYAQISQLVSEVGKMLGGWIRQLQKNSPNT